MLLVVSYSCNTFARYYEKISNIKLLFSIPEPIVDIEKSQDTIVKKIISNTQIQEFCFTIRNFKNMENCKKISEVDFEFEIEIKKSNSIFPIKYELYDYLTNEKILLENNKTEKNFVYKNIEFEKKYKLCLIIPKDNNQNFESDIDIEVNIIQKCNK